MAKLFDSIDEYKKWVEPSNERLLKNAFKKYLEDKPLTAEDFFEEMGKIVEGNKEPDNPDLSTFFINGFKNSIRTVIEKDIIKRIEDFESRLGEINSMLEGKTIEEICMNPKAETGIDRADSIRRAYSGIFVDSYNEMVRKKVLSSNCSSLDEFISRMINNNLGYIFAVLRANHYEYDGIDLRELEGKTLDEIFKLMEDEAKNIELCEAENNEICNNKNIETCGKIGDLFVNIISNAKKDYMEEILKMTREADIYDLIDMYFKKELVNDI